MKNRVMIYLALLGFITLLSQSCKKDNITPPEIENNSHLSPVSDDYFQVLNSNHSDRITKVNKTIIWENKLAGDSLTNNQAVTRNDVNTDNAIWLHVGEVEPYILFGETLSATHVAFLDNRAYISYHKRGAEHLGAIEIVDIEDPANPVVKFRGYLSSADINSIEVGKLPGSDDVKVWLSLSDSKKGAVLGEITMANGSTYDGFKIVNLSNHIDTGISSSANSVTFSGDYLYVSSGKTYGGAFCLNAETLEVLGSVSFENGKYIDVNGAPGQATKVVSLQTGENSSIRTEDIGDFHFATEYQVGEILHQNVDIISRGKSTLHFTSENPNEVYATMGMHGLKRFDIHTGQETWSSPAGMLTTGNTNGLTSDDEFIYLANGADGLSVFTNPQASGEAPQLVFQWDMEESEASANYIEIDGSTEWIFIAKGQGGTKILKRPEYGEYLPINDYNNQGVPENMTQVDICDYLLSDILTSALPASQDAIVAHPEYFADDVPTNIFIEEEADVSVSFVHEGAGYKNVLGYYYYNADNPPTSVDDITKLIVFPNASAQGSGGGLLEGNTVELLGHFKANTVIGFFLNSDGWNNQTITEGIAAHYTNDEFNANGKQSVILNHSACNATVICFDDQPVGSGDNDFNDAIFQINVDPPSALNTTVFPEVD